MKEATLRRIKNQKTLLRKIRTVKCRCMSGAQKTRNIKHDLFVKFC